MGNTIDKNRVEPGANFVHLKTGHFYEIIGVAIIEKTLEEVVVYKSAQEFGPRTIHGDLYFWVRPITEFCDGRFQPNKAIDVYNKL